MRKYLLLVAALTACGPRDQIAAISHDAPAGPCSIGAAAESSVTGLATFSELHAKVPGAGPNVDGTRGIIVTCLTPGPGGTAVTLMFPMLAAGRPAPAGTYHLRRPGEGAVDANLAWAEAQLTMSAPARYVATGGTIRLEAEQDGVLEGSYQLALDRSPETDSRYPAQQVLWGAFRAPRATDRRGENDR
jgi:hypothetical protein